ncbi:uncharacterized protein [Hoplias malabaricus]|uniref:uncharacterized protein isoform X2 n=1 Tax=Hoplias malabaricus TaxID=27720 RepID=UPI0034634B76
MESENAISVVCMRMRGGRPRPSPGPESWVAEDEKDDDVIPCSLCPLCGRDYDRPLLLPCSHTLCGRCLTDGARLDKRRPALRGGAYASPPTCIVLCPRCCHGVELPCFDWSSASSCLPTDPTVSPDRRGEDEGGCDTLGTKPTGKDVDLSEEEMKQSISGLMFALEPSTATPPLYLTNSTLTATYRGNSNPWGNCGDRCQCCDPCAPLPQVCGNVAIHRGQYYWEVDVCNSTLYRIGVSSLADNRAWWLERCGPAFHAVFDGRHELLPSIPPQLKTVGVFLNVGGASLTFHNPLTQELLAAIPSHFSLPLCPALQLGHGRLKLRPGLPPPTHVFRSRGSAYRGPEGAGTGRWRRDVPFGSVRTVIQKFEKMATSDSDSGLTSSYDSSSTLASLPDPNTGPERPHPSGREL